jgi:hypothetical protein
MAPGSCVGSFCVFDPTTFQYTSDDRTVYEVEKRKGLRFMQGRNGSGQRRR